MSALLNVISRIFYKPQYESEATALIESLKRANPALPAQQLAGRALLWDKNIDLGAAADVQAGRIEQSAYVYQTKA